MTLDINKLNVSRRVYMIMTYSSQVYVAHSKLYRLRNQWAWHTNLHGQLASYHFGHDTLAARYHKVIMNIKTARHPSWLIMLQNSSRGCRSGCRRCQLTLIQWGWEVGLGKGHVSHSLVNTQTLTCPLDYAHNGAVYNGGRPEVSVQDRQEAATRRPLVFHNIHGLLKSLQTPYAIYSNMLTLYVRGSMNFHQLS